MLATSAVEDISGKKMAGRKGNILSIGERVTLTNSCLNGIQLYMMSFLELPKGVLDSWGARMLWQEMNNKMKYRLID